MPEPLLIVIAIVVLLLGNGFFSGSEIAIISARKSRIDPLAEHGNRAALRVRELQDNMDRFLATVQIGVTVFGTLAGVLGGVLATRFVEPALAGTSFARFVPATLVASGIVGLFIVYVELILGELVPKALALRFSERIALWVSAPFLAMFRASRLLVDFLAASTRVVLRLMWVKGKGERTFISEEEIKHIVSEGQRQGVLDRTEMEIIHSVFEFNDMPVRKVMVPRPKIFALDADTPPAEVGSLIVESGFSRIPAFEGSIDNMVGLVYVKDALRLLEKRQPVVIRKILHPVHLVPETKKVAELLKELQKRRSHMAVVVDEHGSVSGLVTLEDLIEEIVGEIEDEYDWEERPVEKLRDGSIVVEGTVPASQLREAHHVPLPEGEFETVAGFMLDRLGRVPKGGEVVEEAGYRFTVVDVEKHRISKVKVESRRQAKGAADAARAARASEATQGARGPATQQGSRGSETTQEERAAESPVSKRGTGDR
jgi:putative hemolysin